VLGLEVMHSVSWSNGNCAGGGGPVRRDAGPHCITCPMRSNQTELVQFVPQASGETRAQEPRAKQVSGQ